MDDKKKVKEDRNFVACKEKYEMDYIKGEVKKTNPELSDEQIDEALEFCCKEVPPPRPRKKYMECLEKQLKVTAKDIEVPVESTETAEPAETAGR